MPSLTRGLFVVVLQSNINDHDLCTNPAPTHGGQLVITSGVRDWIDTGVEPWAKEPNPKTLGLEWRRHHIAVIVTSHLSGDQGDTCPEDHASNQAVFNNPGCGERLLTAWHRNGASKIFCITDRYGCPDAVTTVLFASEY